MRPGQSVLDLKKHPHKKNGTISSIDHRGFAWVHFPDISSTPISRNFDEIKLIEPNDILKDLL